jgi:hypothetical protein
MLNNLPFDLKDWAVWIILWMAVGFFTALQMGNAYGCVLNGTGNGPCDDSPDRGFASSPPSHSRQYQQWRDENRGSASGGISERHYYQDKRGFSHGCLTRRFGSTYTTSCN